MKSLLFRDVTPFTESADCAPGRTEVTVSMKKDGRIYRFVIRDKVTVEDPYLVLVKARAFAIRTGEPFGAQPPSRSIRDFLIKSSVVI